MDSVVDYERIQAGRHLDAYVHELVMKRGPAEPSPLYSEDPVAALDVVGAMKKDGFSFHFFENDLGASASFICSRGPCARHGTTFHNHHGSYHIEGATMALAVCRSALCAIMSGAR